MTEFARVIIPDSHGNHIDPKARAAFLKDLKAIDPKEIVMLGDHLDCAGTFSTHQRNYTHEIPESYADDCDAANSFLNEVQKAAPRASIDYIEGNHEAHVERWASRTFINKKDADSLLDKYGPTAALKLKDRGIKYYKRSEHYMGLSIPGCIRKGKCYYVHGVSHSKHAAATHLARFSANVVFGHVHRVQIVGERTVTSDGFLAACCGTLAKLQPLYMHTSPTSWMHAYGLQFVTGSGLFMHYNVPLMSGKSLLIPTMRMLAKTWGKR